MHVSHSTPSIDPDPGVSATATAATTFRFGPFLYDPRRRELRGVGGPVRVGSRALQLLEVLLQSPGRLHGRDELVARVWPDTVVEESSLRVHMSALRRALGEGEDGARYIANVSGRGYVFVGQVEPGAADDAPPRAPARPNAAVRTPPVRLTHPIGREKDMARIGELLAAHRLVSIVGAGGMGKTTVALAAAELQVARHEHGAVFVDLSMLSDGGLVVVAVGRGLGLDLAPDEPWTRLENMLRDQQLLIVLDNCEHVIEAAAALAERLLFSCPGLRLLATSREPLEVQAEWVFRLPPLSAPEPQASLALGEVLSYPAIELFVDRARAASHVFELTEANVSAVRQICAFLEGIPLAIELAAARAHGLGVNGLRQRLEDVFDLLTRGRRTAMSRHQTLLAVMTWSYELLTATEKTVLQRLAVFNSAFDLDDAVEVATCTELPRHHVIGGVLSLCAKSLVVLEDGGKRGMPRHRLLYITRLFARQLLAATPEAMAVHRRHAVFVRDVMVARNKLPGLLAGFRGSPELSSTIAEMRAAITWSLVEENDLLLGLEIVAESTLTAHAAGLTEEFGPHLNLAIERAGRTSIGGAHLLSRLLLTAGLHAGQSLVGSEAHRRAQAVDRCLVDRFDTAADKIEAFTAVCANAYGHGRYRQVVEHCDEIRSLAQGGLERVGVAIGDRFATFALHALGRHDEAERTAARVMQLDVGTLEPRFQSVVPFALAVRIRLARIHWLRGDFQQAWRLVEEILAEDAGDHAYSACQPLGLAAVPIAIWRGDLISATRWNQRLLHHATQSAMPYWQAYARVYACLLEGRPLLPGSPEAEMLEGNVPLRDVVPTLSPAALHPVTLARVRDGDVGWCAPEVLRLAALDKLASHGEDRRAACAAELRDALALSVTQGARFWSLRIAISLCDVATSHSERMVAMAQLHPLVDTLDDGSAQPDLLRARALLAHQAGDAPVT